MYNTSWLNTAWRSTKLYILTQYVQAIKSEKLQIMVCFLIDKPRCFLDNAKIDERFAATNLVKVV